MSRKKVTIQKSFYLPNDLKKDFENHLGETGQSCSKFLLKLVEGYLDRKSMKKMGKNELKKSERSGVQIL